MSWPSGATRRRPPRVSAGGGRSRCLVTPGSWLDVSVEQLQWMADPAGMQRRTRPGWLHLYDYQWVPRPGRVPRLLESPTPILKRAQRTILDALLSRIPVHPAAHGFVPGRSVLTHAARHVGAAMVITMDLEQFFASVSPARLYGILRLAGYPEALASLLTGLCSTRTPVRVIGQMPGGGEVSARQSLRSRLRAGHLPQGAPTSPAVANLVSFQLDARLAGYAQAAGAAYTRYADDLAFSGGPALRSAAHRFVAATGEIVVAEGLSVNQTKTRLQRARQRQSVTGIVVNDHPNVSRAYHDQLRAVLHEAHTRGPQMANRDHHPDFRSHLAGRVEWVESVNPVRGRRLRALLDSIVWDEPD